MSKKTKKQLEEELVTMKEAFAAAKEIGDNARGEIESLNEHYKSVAGRLYESTNMLDVVGLLIGKAINGGGDNMALLMCAHQIASGGDLLALSKDLLSMKEQSVDCGVGCLVADAACGYCVRIHGIVDGMKIAGIKAIRAVLRNSLKDAKDLADSAETAKAFVFGGTGVTFGEAKGIADDLRDSGAFISVTVEEYVR